MASAIFAQFTADSPYTLQGARAPLPPKLPLRMG